MVSFFSPGVCELMMILTIVTNMFDAGRKCLRSAVRTRETVIKHIRKKCCEQETGPSWQIVEDFKQVSATHKLACSSMVLKQSF